MKTLIVNGSTRKGGDTETLVSELMRHLDGEIKLLTHKSAIAPCSDCRHCWTKEGCAMQDEMQEVYAFLRNCDNVVLASPIWFSSLSGPMLNIASRIQMLYATNAFRNIPFTMTPKNGVAILTGGEPSTAANPKQTILTIMKFMGVRRPIAAEVCSLLTNDIPAKSDTQALTDAREAALLLNRLYQDKH